MWVRVAIAIVVFLLPTALHAQAEKRIALLIGNRAYDASVGVLKNPHNDVAVVGEALTKQGFEVLPPIRDARRSTILGSVRELVRKLNTAGAGAIGFLYYSGHGAAEKDTNINYLIPVDAKEPGTTAFWDESLKLDDILKLLDGARSAAKFIVFDACRNELQLPTKDTTKGLVPVAEQQGMFIAYASAPGRTASDRGDKSGPYAEALAIELGKPGVDHLSLFQNVKEAVYAGSGGAQQPWESNGLVRRVYLTGKPTQSPQAPAASTQLSEVAEAWDRVKETSSILVLESYVTRYKDSIYAELARARIDDLKRQQVPAIAPTRTPDSTPPKPLEPAAAVPSKRGQPTTITGTVRCESYPAHVCDLNTYCSWDDSSKQCQRKSGSLATAMLEALPPSKPASQTPCLRIEALVGNEQRCLKLGDSFRDCPECPEMVVVPAGEFMMGSPASEAEHRSDEEPQRKVTIAQPVAVGKFEVTFAEWDACVADGGCKDGAGDKGWGRSKQPVIYVSWNDTNQYLAWLSRKTRRTYRLLSEAEWEYAARAGTTTPYATGRTIITDQANFNGKVTYGNSAKGQDRGRTIEVGSFAPNAFGLHDMHGNVSEWVEDCYLANYAGAPTDGSARLGASADCPRVVRGGSWIDTSWSLRATARYRESPLLRRATIGFRVARTLTP
jgi:formylglycine-generating enzyme required for sulfatase activity/uncharacterized caspase-like protein